MSNYNPPAPPASPESKTIFEHAQRLTEPVYPVGNFDGVPAMLRPPGWVLEPIPGWEQQQPRRVEETVTMHTAESFSRYVSTFKNPNTAIFADLTPVAGTFVAVIDYHQPVLASEPIPNWGRHRVAYVPKKTVEWTRWQEVDRKKMSQQEFALFLEENTPAVVSPPGADLLAIVNALEINGAVTFQSAQRLASGSVSFQYVNEQKAKAGNMEVPTEFALRLPIYEGEAPSPINARLRWRLTGGQLGLWFELVNPHVAITDALEVIAARIQTGTAINPYRGSAPA